MKKVIIITLMGLLWLTAGLIAESKAGCDLCTDGLIYFVIVNDPDYADPPGTITYPSGATVTDCCPNSSFLPADTAEHHYFPDTLAHIDVIDSAIAAHTPGVLNYSYTYDGWYYTGSPGSDSLQIPPLYPNTVHDGCCCVDGIYWKVRVLDNVEGWSAWSDVNSPGQSNVFFGEILIAMVNTGAFKKRDFGANIVFECDVDTVEIYVWDCNDGDRAGTAQEFGAIRSAYANPTEMSADTVFLRRWFEVGAIDDKPQLPNEYFISQNLPNPFNARTAINYGLPEDAEVEIQVTNLLGQRVSTLVSEYQTAGYKRIVWNGMDNTGRELPSGVYFYTIRANDFTAKKRAILMK